MPVFILFSFFSFFYFHNSSQKHHSFFTSGSVSCFIYANSPRKIPFWIHATTSVFFEGFSHDIKKTEDDVVFILISKAVNFETNSSEIYRWTRNSSLLSLNYFEPKVMITFLFSLKWKQIEKISKENFPFFIFFREQNKQPLDEFIWFVITLTNNN